MLSFMFAAQAIVLPAPALEAVAKPFRRLRELNVPDTVLTPAEVAGGSH